MKTEKPIVMYDSDAAASIKTVTGWVSRTGRFWGNVSCAANLGDCAKFAVQLI